MTMEKTGEIRPGKTPDTEQRLAHDKEAAVQPSQSQVEKLDDDITNRLAQAAE